MHYISKYRSGVLSALLALVVVAMFGAGAAWAGPAANAAEGYKPAQTATAEGQSSLLVPVRGGHGHGGHGHGGHHFHGGGHWHGGHHWHGGRRWYGGGSYFYDPYFYGPRYYYGDTYYYARPNRGYRRCRLYHGPRYCRRHWRRYL